MADIPKTCKAAALYEFGEDLRVIDVPVPQELPDKAILVKVSMAGVCGSDIHIQSGSMGIKPPLPCIMGHETIGRIAKLGKGRVCDAAEQPLKEGDRIIWGHPFCYDCYDCNIANTPAMCSHIGGELRLGYGMSPLDRLMGGFSEYEYVSPMTKVLKIPDELTDEEVIGVACAFRSVVSGFEKLNKIGGITLGDTVLIQGAGPIGLYSLLLAVESNATQVIVVGAPAERLELAKEWGATHTIDIFEVTDAKKRLEMIREYTGGRGPEVVIEASGFPPAVEEGLEMIKKGGKYLILGQTSLKETTFIPHYILQKNLTVIGSGGAEIRHFYRAMQFIKSRQKKFDFGKMVSSKYCLNDINVAFANMKAGKDVKAAIVFD